MIDDENYDAYFFAQIEAGMKDAREGRIVTQDEAKRRMKKWLNFDGSQPQNE